MTDQKTQPPQRSGALRSDITVTLNTLYAFNLWRGGGATASNIPSMNFCLSRLLWINSGSRGDDLYANQIMYRLELQIAGSKKVLTALQETVNAQLATLLKGSASRRSRQPIPLRCPQWASALLALSAFSFFFDMTRLQNIPYAPARYRWKSLTKNNAPAINGTLQDIGWIGSQYFLEMEVYENAVTRLGSTVGMATSFPAFDAMCQALPMVQAICCWR